MFPKLNILRDIGELGVGRSLMRSLCEAGDRRASVFDANVYVVSELKQLHGWRNETSIHFGTYLDFDTIRGLKGSDNL